MSQQPYMGPDGGNVDILVHLTAKSGNPNEIRNVDPDCFGIFDVHKVVNILAEDEGLPPNNRFKIYFLSRGSSTLLPLKTDVDILRMFKTNANSTCIHVYVSEHELNQLETNIGAVSGSVIEIETEIVIVSDFVLETEDETEIDNMSIGDRDEVKTLTKTKCAQVETATEVHIEPVGGRDVGEIRIDDKSTQDETVIEIVTKLEGTQVETATEVHTEPVGGRDVGEIRIDDESAQVEIGTEVHTEPVGGRDEGEIRIDDEFSQVEIVIEVDNMPIGDGVDVEVGAAGFGVGSAAGAGGGGPNTQQSSTLVGKK